MKKRKKIIIYIVTVVLSLIILDAGQALLFNNSPIIRFHILVVDHNQINKIDKGLLVNTYYCINGTVTSVFKGFSYSCISDKPTFKIEDTSKNDKRFKCELTLEQIYDDGEDVYYLPCVKSSKIIVTYNNGIQENVKDALKYGHINIRDLDKFGILYLIQ